MGHNPHLGLLDRYEEWLREQGLSETTIRQRLTFIDRRLDAWGTLDVPGAVVAEYLAGYHGWTRRTYHNHLTSAYRWLTEVGELQVSPLAKMRRPPSPRPRPKPLTAAEVALVLDHAHGNVRAFILLGLFAGLRCFEIAKVRGEDVTERYITVLGKGGQLAAIPTHPLLWELACSYPREGWWFPSRFRDVGHVSVSWVGNSVHDVLAGLGITGSIHRTRATYGTNLLRNGANVKVVQELMRHSSLESTAHYLGVADDELTRAIGTLAA
jgi:integrase/recombinase XerD